jgi:hypothetical protein
MQIYNAYDPKEKKDTQDEPLQRQENEEGVYLVNDDGTDFDSSERTYVSVDLPEEESSTENADDSGE